MPQISFAYCLMVRSLLKAPLRAVERMDDFVHFAWSLYAASTRSCAST